MSEEPDIINATLDNGRSLRQLLLMLFYLLHFKLLGKVKNLLNSDQQQQIKICFMIVPVSRDGDYDIC